MRPRFLNPSPLAGGMLGITVPEFRLPRQVIEAEIRYIQSAG